MYKAIVSCEVVTPMFIAGADGKTPELRAASIKGVIRYWWRALQGEPDLEKLRKRETELFGGTGGEGGKEKQEKNSGRKSAVKIFISLYPEKGNVSNDSFYDNYKNPDLNYLFYSVRAMQKRPYFQTQTLFNVTFIARKSEDIQEALRAFLTASLFGGLGSRTRRGGGSFRIKKIEADKPYLELPINIDSPKELQSYIQRTILPKSYTESYSTLKKMYVYIFEPQKDWKKALNTVAAPFQEFRKKNEAKAALTPIFGLPLKHKSGGIKITPKLERRASPLIVKIIAASNKQGQTLFFPVFLRFSNRFLPDKYQIETAREGKSKPNEKLLNEFFQNLKNVKAQFQL